MENTFGFFLEGSPLGGDVALARGVCLLPGCGCGSCRGIPIKSAQIARVSNESFTCAESCPTTSSVDLDCMFAIDDERLKC